MGFAVECFSSLAWPLIALGYPLCASIQAIETDSTDTQKLITYWVCFSLILLFEHAFLKLLLWLPWWTYIKLAIVGCLVTPHFDGSFYVYKHIVHPCFSMDLHSVMNRLIKLKWFFKQDMLVIEVKRDAKETETEALDNLIDFKPEFEESKVALAEPDPVLAIIRTSDPQDFKEGIPTAKDLPNVLPYNNIQMEWTCSICQVTTTCEANLISHLHGRRHKDARENLKAHVRQKKIDISKDSDEFGRLPDVIEMEKCRDNLAKKPHSKSTHEPWTCVLCQVTTTTKTDLVSHFRGRRHKDSLEKLEAKVQISKINNSPPSAETGLNLHDRPRRHEDACENYKAYKQTTKSVWCSICNISCSSEGNMEAHLSGNMHLTRIQLNNVGSRLEI
ncbi:hypothetical protein MANES_10G096300v8 [Manihot esculenta]|uniref:Uncharacterized protein n=1 Tax=Manihot esculenta TaxID=3983 RepID=A0ACB7H0U2_MANES|nr:hypothetical protein MANES_10G096300v8 [Manihot esculenta]